MADPTRRALFAVLLRDAARTAAQVDRALGQLTARDLQQLDAAVVLLLALSRKVFPLDPER